MKSFEQTHSNNNIVLRWFLNRTKDQTDEIILNRKIIYILPTRYGVLFGFILLIMLLGSINYSISMGFLLTFLLSGLSVSGMLYTYQNLLNLKIQPHKSESVFCGEVAIFKLSANFESSHDGHSIYYGINRKLSHKIDIINSNREILSIPITTTHRGYLSLKPVRIWTQFPLGIFHAWSWVNPKVSIIIYPKPKGQPLKLKSHQSGSATKNSTKPGHDDYAGMRKYVSGDSLKHIAWKAVAKGHDLHTKQYSEFGADNIWLAWNDIPYQTSIEQKLSQLCLWVLEAEKKELCYGLQLPTLSIKPGYGDAHKIKCLTSLALYLN